MIFSSRMPKERRFGKPKNNRSKFSNKMASLNKELILRGAENLSHPQLRELQRYGTLSVDKKAIVNDICNDKAIIIKKDDEAITALVRYTNRYYIAVMDTKIKVIKTFLPDNICNFSEYVNQYIEKENSKAA